MLEAGGSFRFPTKTLQVRFAWPTEPRLMIFERHCAIETLLPGAKYHPLTASADFFQQLVITQFSEHLRSASCSFYSGERQLAASGFNVCQEGRVIRLLRGYRCRFARAL